MTNWTMNVKKGKDTVCDLLREIGFDAARAAKIVKVGDDTYEVFFPINPLNEIPTVDAPPTGSLSVKQMIDKAMVE